MDRQKNPPSFEYLPRGEDMSGIVKAFPEQTEQQQELDWQSEFETTKNGTTKSNAFNTFLIFNNDENLKGKFAYNLLTKNPEIIGKVPWKRANDTNEITPQDDSCSA